MPNFKTIKPNEKVSVRIEEIKKKYEELEYLIRTENPTRELALAITNLEQSSMWAVKNIILQESPKTPMQAQPPLSELQNLVYDIAGEKIE